MKTYQILTPIKIGDEIKKSGTVSFDDDQAKELLAIGAIGDVVIDYANLSTEERLPLISAAIQTLNVDNGEIWLKDGKPTVDAVVNVLGWKISASERDQAWSNINANQNELAKSQPSQPEQSAEALSKVGSETEQSEAGNNQQQGNV